MAVASVTRETNCMNAVDTNVFIYLFDVDEPTKQVRARACINNLMQSTTSTVLL